MKGNLTEAQPSAALPTPAPSPSSARPRVLLIEDNFLDARFIQIMLNDAGGEQFGLQEFGQDRLLAAAREFAGRRDFDDDVCLVGMEVARLAPVGEGGGGP